VRWRKGSTNSPEQPSLIEFAAAQGMEDVGEAKQLEAYAAVYPGAGQRMGKEVSGAGQGGAAAPAYASRRARLVERQMEALRWMRTIQFR
jgi:hypothetical protein